VPELRADYLLVKTQAVAVNPHDWRVVDFMGEVGCRLGCDYSGIVEEVGSKVTKDFKKGGQLRLPLNSLSTAGSCGLDC